MIYRSLQITLHNKKQAMLESKFPKAVSLKELLKLLYPPRLNKQTNKQEKPNNTQLFENSDKNNLLLVKHRED